MSAASPSLTVLPRWLPGAIGAGLVAYVAALAWSERHGLGTALSALNGFVLFAVLGLSLVNYGLRFVRWDGWMRRLGHALPRQRHGLVYLAGFALTVSPAKAGESVRSLYLRGHGVPVTHSLATLFVERALDLLAVALLALLLGLGSAQRTLLVGGALLAVAVLGVLAWPGLAGVLRQLGTWSSLRRLRGLLLGMATLLGDARVLLRPRRLLLGLALGLPAWAAEGYGLYLLLQALGADVGVSFAIGAYALALVAGAASFLPGGLGGAEAALIALLVGASLPLPAAVAATALCRLATLWFAVLLGLAAMAALHAGSRRR